jgi:HAD superfamily hydrolase (TIGR01484 family)
MTVQAIVLDVDGTLLDPRHRVTEATRRAIARAQAAGMRIVLASARSPDALTAVAEQTMGAGDLLQRRLGRRPPV